MRGFSSVLHCLFCVLLLFVFNFPHSQCLPTCWRKPQEQGNLGYGVVRSPVTPERTAAVQQGFSFRVLLLLTLSPHTWLLPLCPVGVTNTMIPRIRLDAERRLCWEPLSLSFYISFDLCLKAEIQFQGPGLCGWAGVLGSSWRREKLFTFTKVTLLWDLRQQHMSFTGLASRSQRLRQGWNQVKQILIWFPN